MTQVVNDTPAVDKLHNRRGALTANTNCMTQFKIQHSRCRINTGRCWTKQEQLTRLNVSVLGAESVHTEQQAVIRFFGVKGCQPPLLWNTPRSSYCP
jgi:hypothetical protein